ncbi:MAG: sorbosone dehydrogenase family protein [Xanthomonadales bacterium]|nr:sorbosone dehydrogenase family protein [Xanthomonadales bacterium]
MKSINKLRLHLRVVSALLSLAAAQVIAPAIAAADEDLSAKLALIELPPGFEIRLYASGVENARQLAQGDKATVFAGSRRAGKVHAVVDEDGDGKADRVYLLDEDLQMPSGIEFRDGALYVGAVDRILRYDDIETRLDDPPAPVLVTDRFPDATHHGWKYLRFGPDGLLYVPVGAPCNICDEPGFAEIRRIRADGSGEEVYAQGVRNSVGLAFHPDSGELWFTDNGRDMMGDNLPGDELNHAPRAGLYFGYPYCHQGDVPDPEFGAGKSCDDYRPPARVLGPHVAALGLSFYTGEMFPPEYRGDLFIAQHGSWNRSEKIGYDILRVRFGERGEISGSETFARGWLQGEDNWGRPNDVLQLPDGSLLIPDDQQGVIYRVVYRDPSE